MDEGLRDHLADLDSDVDTFANWLRGFKPPPETYIDTPHDPASNGLLADVEQYFAEAPRDNVVTKMLSDNVRYWLTDNLLYKIDHTTMNASVEARVPFLNHEFGTYAYNIPPESKIGDGVE